MYSLYLLSVWLHILAATTWIGGMFFLVLVVVPWLRRGERLLAVTVLRDTGRRFRVVGWACFGILLVTGGFNLWMRGVRLADVARPQWRSSVFGTALLWKLGVFGLVLAISAVHDFVLGPRATLAIERDVRSTQAQQLRRMASWLGRLNVLLALVLVALAVVLVRGC